MTTTAGEAAAGSFVRPRPGLARALGIGNLIVATLMIAAVAMSLVWLLIASRANVQSFQVRLESAPSAAASAPKIPLVTMDLAGFGVDDPGFFRFVLLDSATALILNVLMFASGIGLINLRAWGARWWSWLAWMKIIRLILFWGGYVVLVAPSLSDRMARYVIQTASFPAGRGPQLAQLTGIYGVMNLVLAVVMIVFGCVYPAASLWFVRRPGLRKALGGPILAEVQPT